MMGKSNQLPRATRRRGAVLLQVPAGVVWIRHDEALTFVSGEDGGWLLCGGKPLVRVAGPEEAQAAMSAVWNTFERSLSRLALGAGLTLGWVSALLLVAGLVLVMPRQRVSTVASAAPPTVAGGALDRMD